MLYRCYTILSWMIHIGQWNIVFFSPICVASKVVKGILNTYYYNFKMFIFKKSPKHLNIVKTYLGTNTVT